MKTSQLEEQLGIAEEFDEALIRENGVPDFLAVLAERMKEKGITRAELIKRLDIDRSYGYQLLNGRRVPTRVQLIKLCFMFRLTLEETQRLLKIAGKEILYARNMTDAKIIYSIEHKLDYDKACEFIWAE